MARDIYKEVTDKIIAELETGAAPWIKPWKDDHKADGMLPYNAVSMKPYNGINVMLLWIAGDKYSSNGWVTYKQAQQLGGNVRKGERGTTIIFWKVNEYKNVDSAGEEHIKKVPMLRNYTVFNVEQCDGLKLKETETRAAPSGYSATLAELNGAEVVHGGNRACFIPSVDRIHMPHQDQFDTVDSYDATLYHELTHWTGAKKRLSRNMSGMFGSSEYAAEELVAELGSAFLCARYGVNGEMRHSGYIKSWLKALREDKRAIFTAAKLAQKAVDHLTAVEQEIEEAA